jgi:hypothetical protein
MLTTPFLLALSFDSPMFPVRDVTTCTDWPTSDTMQSLKTSPLNSESWDGSSSKVLYFEIDNQLLRKQSRRPHHIARRFDRSVGEDHSGTTSGSEDDSDGFASTARAISNRQSLLAQRQEKLAKRNLIVREAGKAANVAKDQASAHHRKEMEETLASAAQNRRRIVAEKQRQCALVVRKAKEIARRAIRENKEELARRKAELEEKQRKTRWRRQQIAKLPRTQLLSHDSVQSVLRSGAALDIQAWWRSLKLEGLISQYKTLLSKPSAQEPSGIMGILNIEVLSAMDFHQAATTLQTPALIRTTSRMLLRLKKLAVDPPSLGKTPARVFLTCFMLLTHCNSIVEDVNGPLEKVHHYLLRLC